VAKKARTAWQTVHQMSTIDWEERAVKDDRRERKVDQGICKVT